MDICTRSQDGPFRETEETKRKRTLVLGSFVIDCVSAYSDPGNVLLTARVALNSQNIFLRCVRDFRQAISVSSPCLCCSGCSY
jgi:hypothetical protein